MSAVAALVALNVAIFGYEGSLPAGGAREALIDGFALIPYDLTHGAQIAGAPPTAVTLVTAQFLHASVPHVAFNMLFLAAFGPAVERSIGSARFVGFYVACGVLGGLAHVWADPGSHVPEIGASGAVAGVLGAYLLRFPARPLLFGVPAVLVIGMWAAVQFVHGFGTLSTNVVSERGGGTAYFAHIGGFLAGIFLLACFGSRTAPRRGRAGTVRS